MFHLSEAEKTWLLPMVELHKKVYVTLKICATFQLRTEQRKAMDVMLHAECGYLCLCCL